METKKEHWCPNPQMILVNLQGLNMLKIALWPNHRMNFQDMGERWDRRSLLVEEIVAIFKELDINYRLLPLDVNIQTLPQVESSRYPTAWTPPAIWSSRHEPHFSNIFDQCIMLLISWRRTKDTRPWRRFFNGLFFTIFFLWQDLGSWRGFFNSFLLHPSLARQHCTRSSICFIICQTWAAREFNSFRFRNIDVINWMGYGWTGDVTKNLQFWMK